jgi:hypothetical protein
MGALRQPGEDPQIRGALYRLAGFACRQNNWRARLAALSATLARESGARLHLLHVGPLAVPCRPADVDLYLDRGRRAHDKLIEVDTRRNKPGS